MIVGAEAVRVEVLDPVTKEATPDVKEEEVEVSCLLSQARFAFRCAV